MKKKRNLHERKNIKDLGDLTEEQAKLIIAEINQSPYFSFQKLGGNSHEYVGSIELTRREVPVVVGYISSYNFSLVNRKNPSLKEYHKELKKIYDSVSRKR